MHAFIVIGDSENYINKFVGHKIEFPLAKIEDVRELSSFTRLKVTEKTVIVIKDFDNANSISQNAFLKALEEPQENLSYILTVTNLHNILPTIVSRCEIIEFSNVKTKLSDEESDKINSFINGKLGDRLFLISKINKREEAIIFMQNLISVCHTRFLEDSSTVRFLEYAASTLKNLEVNGNVQLQLTNYVANITN